MHRVFEINDLMFTKMQQDKKLKKESFEAIADRLALVSNEDVAFVQADNQIFFSRVVAKKGPSSAVVKLIQGVFDLHRDLSFFILRQRIWTTEALGPMAKGMVRVAAKRVSEIQRVTASGPSILQTYPQMIEVGTREAFVFMAQSLVNEMKIELPRAISTDLEGIHWAIRLADSVRRGEVLHDHNRPIGALLCASDGTLLGSAVNSASLNKTLHAEVRLIQEYYLRTGQMIPRGAKIFVSLKPCHMCAGMIFESCEDNSDVEVIYAQEDPGRLARETILDLQGLSCRLNP